MNNTLIETPLNYLESHEFPVTFVSNVQWHMYTIVISLGKCDADATSRENAGYKVVNVKYIIWTNSDLTATLLELCDTAGNYCEHLRTHLRLKAELLLVSLLVKLKVSKGEVHHSIQF